MPIELGIWKLGDNAKPERVAFESVDLERKLEDALSADLSLIEPNLLFLGRQVSTSWGKFIDILAMDNEGNILIIELKRDKTPREVVAQVLDYASWLQKLSREEIVAIFRDKNPGMALEAVFEESFGETLPENLNTSHRMMIVATELDSATERILEYLTDNYNVPINAVFFNYFKRGNEGFLARTWLIDPHLVDSNSSRSNVGKKTEPWNGRDYYVNLGEGEARNWDDCRKYGFVSAGGGKWYSNSLQHLQPGDRIFAYLAGKDSQYRGYVGVGVVTRPVKPVDQVHVEVDGVEKLLLDVPLQADMRRHLEDRDACEYVVRVRWIKSHPREQAYREKGLFAQQNTVCKLKNAFTLEKLYRHFDLDEIDLQANATLSDT